MTANDEIELLIAIIFGGLPMIFVAVSREVLWVPLWVPTLFTGLLTGISVVCWLGFKEEANEAEEEVQDLKHKLKGYKGIVDQIDQETVNVEFDERENSSFYRKTFEMNEVKQ